MNSQRKGSNLKTQIRMALSFLDRDQIEFGRMTIAELTNLNSELNKEVARKHFKDIGADQVVEARVNWLTQL